MHTWRLLSLILLKDDKYYTTETKNWLAAEITTENNIAPNMPGHFQAIISSIIRPHIVNILTDLFSCKGSDIPRFSLSFPGLALRSRQASAKQDQVTLCRLTRLPDIQVRSPNKTTS
jgi:hypothetical protein